MSPQPVLSPVPWILLASAIAALVISRYTWERRRQPGAAWLALAELAAGIWAGLDLFNYLADLPAVEIAVKSSTWALIIVAGLAFFRFACTYTRRERWWQITRAPIIAAIILNFVVMATNHYHHLMWPGVRWVDIGFARVPWLESGPAFFWLFRPTAYGLPLAGVLVLVIGTAGSQVFYLRQIALVVVAALVPVIANFFLVSTTAPGVDLTPVTVVMVAAALAWSTVRLGLLDVMPVARSLLLEQIDDGVVVLDGNEGVVELNPAARSLLGCEPRKPGTPAEQTMPFWRNLKSRIESAEGQAIEVDLGSEPLSVIELTSSPIHAETGVSLGRMLVLHDITAQARLIRDLDVYAETVARDLKKPLVDVIGRIEALGRSNRTLGDESTEHLRAAERMCSRMTSTIDALLWFSQLRSDEKVVVEPLDMGKIVESALQRLSAAVAQSKAELSVSERWPPATGQPVWVEEVWTNYISNAIKYGGSPPRVELGASQDDAQRRRYWVRDNGPGLNEQQRSRLFTEFTRLDPQRSEGHGLGLSIVQRIVEKLGGTVGCDSKGSTFWFTLPS